MQLKVIKNWDSVLFYHNNHCTVFIYNETVIINEDCTIEFPCMEKLWQYNVIGKFVPITVAQLNLAPQQQKDMHESYFIMR